MPGSQPHETSRAPARGGSRGKGWRVHGERTIYRSPWVSLGLADVELPDGSRIDHHLVRFPELRRRRW